jgi:hypothetical protein
MISPKLFFRSPSLFWKIGQKWYYYVIHEFCNLAKVTFALEFWQELGKKQGEQSGIHDLFKFWQLLT